MGFSSTPLASAENLNLRSLITTGAIVSLHFVRDDATTQTRERVEFSHIFVNHVWAITLTSSSTEN
jgi:hypothetical protein